MTVYIVVGSASYTNLELFSVHQTEQGARQAIKDLIESENNPSMDYKFLEMELQQ